MAPKLFTFARFPESQWKSIRASNAIVVRQTRHERLHEEFKRRVKTQIALPPSAAMSFWALLASGQITIAKIDGWRNLAEGPFDKIIDLAA